jgi:ribosomal protein S18 acetylase RimI-like enzyme
MEVNIDTLERATLDAVAPHEVIEIDGWLLPMDRSTIGRAISAVPTRHKNLSPQNIDAIEAIYQSRGLPTQFRLPDHEGCQSLVAVLEQKGYRPSQATLVQVASAGGNLRSAVQGAVVMAKKPSHEWRSVYLADCFDQIDGQNRVDALSRSTFVRYAHIVVLGHSVASGTASNSHGWAGLHGLRTILQARGHGHATAIIEALLQDVIRDGAINFYLQVEESNVGAIRLYSQFGFSTAWRYHYWKKTVQ